MTKKILVTNDDGVSAPGLLALVQEVRKLDGVEVAVLAPDHNWSACGHVKTMSRPMRVRSTKLEDGSQAWTSDGAPSDCVALALMGALEQDFDLVVSGINPNANMIVAPSDHLILKESDFLDCIREGLDFVQKKDALLTLGIKPNRPETGYGYIQVGNLVECNVNKIKTFTEKPNAELAKVFLESGEFLWNAGIFLWSVRSILAAFDEFQPEIAGRFNTGLHLFNTDKEAAFIDEIFPACPNISIDYGILEKASNVFVQAAEFGWSDLGTWGSLHDLSNKDDQQNAVLKGETLLYESKGNLVSIPEGKLAVLHKMEGYIVAESDNVLMICKMEDEQVIRQFVLDAQLKKGDAFA